MSYLTLPEKDALPNFSKAVISLWFRIPKASVIAAATQQGIKTEVPNFNMMQQILPLVTFGRQQKSKIYETPSHNVAVIHPHPTIPGEPDPNTKFDTIYYKESASYSVDPSYIGLGCNKDGTFHVGFNLQMDGFMSFSATSFITTRVDIYSGSDPSAPVAESSQLGSGVIAIFPDVGVTAIEDVSYVNNVQPEVFTVNSNKSYDSDHWHHLLLSFDVSGSVSIGTPFASSNCRLWYAIDDVDYRGAENLQPYRDTGGQWGHDTLDPNAILTNNAWRYSGSDPNFEAIHYYMNHYVGLPSGSYSNGKIPSENAELGFPASSAYVESIFQVQMAEFQMWTDVTLDTGKVKNRRAFIDEKGKPELDFSISEKLLGKKPELKLHKSGNWKKGENTGTLGDPKNPDLIATAKIVIYRPDPSLHGPQNPGEKAAP